MSDPQVRRSGQHRRRPGVGARKAAMKPAVLSALLLLLLVVPLAGCMELGNQEMTAGDIRREYLAHQESVREYSATLQMTGPAGVRDGQTVVTAKAPCRYRREHLDEAGLPERIEVCNGSVLWRYTPGTGAVEQVPATGEICTALLHEDYQRVVARVVAENAIAYRGVEGVNGSRAHVVEAAPDNPCRYTGREFALMRAWIDTSTWMVDRVDFADGSGDCLLSAEYANIAVNPGIPDSTFTFVPPEEAGEAPLIPLTFPL
ncbi:outer membrane lipoprotein carrier protein LolA [Methanoculleus sp. FWC-SCC1]|uniref:Outer membrane lipoprotein carrier protein LolA n=1 Tax=Methanoculleus frigidifontis TaxID=2584085 RepID=A0ABT8MDU6_9EURY|nr:hypothetical protein [Methanoculleus sp. FWC-SCC1]MDN7026106.1 outer membrane lipoprotein carrier protein LolA [Methanoculleus sp. FWC-SCC1]